MRPAIDYASLEDRQLLEAVLRKNEAAWCELLRRYRPLMFRCILKVAQSFAVSPEDVQEIFGELCVSLLAGDMRALRAYDPARGSRLGSWLGLLASHATYDFLRHARRQRTDLLPLPEALAERPQLGPTALDDLLEKERWRALAVMVKELSEKDRRFVELYYGAGMLADEVAAILAISVKTVYSKKNKVRAKLLSLRR